MSTFQSSAPEPKKHYLNLLITLDFKIAEILYISQNYTLAINGLEALISQAMLWTVKELETTVKKIDEYADHADAPITELRTLHREIQKYLHTRWFSELQLGIIPTGTLPHDSKPPANTPLDPKQSSRI